MLRKFVFAILLIAMVGIWVMSDTFFPPELVKAPSAKVRDGDTIVVNETTFRLYGIDAPEYRQMCKDMKGADWPCGKAARAQLEAHVLSGSIVCEPRAEDVYNRKVAKCASATVPDLSEAMVQAGLAISPAMRGTAAYADAEEAARDAKRGIWQGEFEMPSDYRAAHPRGSKAEETAP